MLSCSQPFSPTARSLYVVLTRCLNSCQACHRRKVKCSGTQPCQSCSKHDWECNYGDVGRKRYSESYSTHPAHFFWL
ncbi:hypothetical protein K431DRAFT_235962 [Polychaeton citri CBS 116435]|uniref:Zn(2)-C6 fungal-type domain-containing protein n=1 Tax=Polychaeton citri CBS 116435 TaxID=1314669 RepID=A0A9P4Q150_9PEZI|nr:hypothetical protein K431DRAFT_235962 [Polychaeton citri CBS 116435]